MLYAVKFEFDTETSMRSATRVLVYPTMLEAVSIFHPLSLAYAQAKPVVVNNGKSINILGTWLYEVDEQDSDRAVEVVTAGRALLVDFAPELAIDIDDPTDENWT